jgi:hypothetical protein
MTNLEELLSTTSGKTDVVKNRHTDEEKPAQDISMFEAPELSDEDYTEHSAGIIANALDRTGLVEIYEITVEKTNQFVLSARVKTESEKDFITKILRSIQMKTYGQMETFFCQHYFIKELKGGKLQQVFSWKLAFGGIESRDAAKLVSEAIDDIIPKMEVMESPLLGPGTPQGVVGGKSKGASTIRG